MKYYVFYNEDGTGIKVQSPGGEIEELLRHGYVEVSEEEFNKVTGVSGHDESESEPTQLDQIEAQVTYTAMMTDTLLEV